MQEPFHRGWYIVEKHYHECSMCGKKVLQDYAILDKHMRGNHNIDITEYKVRTGICSTLVRLLIMTLVLRLI